MTFVCFDELCIAPIILFSQTVWGWHKIEQSNKDVTTPTCIEDNNMSHNTGEANKQQNQVD